MKYRLESQKLLILMKAMELNYEVTKTESIPFSSDLLSLPRLAVPLHGMSIHLVT